MPKTTNGWTRVAQRIEIGAMEALWSINIPNIVYWQIVVVGAVNHAIQF